MDPKSGRRASRPTASAMAQRNKANSAPTTLPRGKAKSGGQRVEPARQKERRRRDQQQKRRRTILWTAGIVVLAAVVAVGLYFFVQPSNSFARPVDGITCDQGEHATEHIHQELVVYVNGQQVQVPAGIGIPAGANCYFWLHTHQTDGVIHVEAPAQGTYRLGEFFDIWAQTEQTSVLTNTSFLGYPLKGHSLVVWTSQNGQPAQRYTGNLRNVVLQNHEIITVAYDSPTVKPVTQFDWANSSAGG
jgi:hypothetical protein